MNNQLKSIHIILTIIFILINCFIIASYGWIGFATLTERTGLNGDYYYYYQLTRLQFYTYNFLVAIVALIFIILFIKNLFQKDLQKLKKSFSKFGIFIGILFLIELFLSMRSIGKG
jgi:hypothetical protein